MGFKNFDKPDNENVENVEKPDAKDDGEKEKISDKVKGFFDKMKAGKEGKEDGKEGKEGKEDSKEGKDNKEANKEENKEKQGEEKKDNPWALSPDQLKEYNAKMDKIREDMKNKKDAGDNNDSDPDKDQKVRERDDMER